MENDVGNEAAETERAECEAIAERVVLEYQHSTDPEDAGSLAAALEIRDSIRARKRRIA
jgi:hypothetical protein